MPNYCVKCEECEVEETHFAMIADRNDIVMSCGHVGRLVIKPTQLIEFRSGWYEHIASEPIYVENKQQLANECRKNGVYSRYLEDSPVGTRFEKREV